MDNYKIFWDRHVGSVGPVKAVTNWDAKTYTNFYREVFADIAEHKVKTVVDVGCGPALLYPLLCELYGEIDYYGYDVSEDMILYAQAAVPSGTFALVEDKLNIAQAPDLIICHSVFTHVFPDTVTLYLKAFKKALAKGGVISVSIHTETTKGFKGGISRMDYAPDYFEKLVKAEKLKVANFVDVAVPAGVARYYRLTK